MAAMPISAAQLSYITRRSYLGPAVAQIYNTSPVLCGLLSKNANPQRVEV
jgi:hypothetical protein